MICGIATAADACLFMPSVRMSNIRFLTSELGACTAHIHHGYFISQRSKLEARCLHSEYEQIE